MVLTFLYSAARKLCPHLIMGIQPWFLKGQESLLSFSRNENVEIILEAIFFFFFENKECISYIRYIHHSSCDVLVLHTL